MQILQISNFDIVQDLEISGYNPFKFQLKKGFTVEVKHEFACFTEELYIPRGWDSDGASIPSFLQPIIGDALDKQFIIPAIVHDYLCCRKHRPQWFTHSLFRELLKYNGVGFFKRQAMFLAVLAWNKKKNPKWK